MYSNEVEMRSFGNKCRLEGLDIMPHIQQDRIHCYGWQLGVLCIETSGDGMDTWSSSVGLFRLVSGETSRVRYELLCELDEPGSNGCIFEMSV